MFVETREPVHSLARGSSLRLLKRPWLNDMQALLDHDPADQILPEPAQETLTSTRKSLVGWCEAASTWALEAWTDTRPSEAYTSLPDEWQNVQTTWTSLASAGQATRESDLAFVSPNELDFSALRSGWSTKVTPSSGTTSPPNSERCVHTGDAPAVDLRDSENPIAASAFVTLSLAPGCRTCRFILVSRRAMKPIPAQ